MDLRIHGTTDPTTGLIVPTPQDFVETPFTPTSTAGPSISQAPLSSGAPPSPPQDVQGPILQTPVAVSSGSTQSASSPTSPFVYIAIGLAAFYFMRRR